MSSNVLREISIWPRYCQDGDDNQRGESLFCGENLLQSNLSRNGSSTFARHNVDMDTRLLLRNLLRQESNDILSIEQTFGYSFDSWQGNKGLKAYMRGIVVTWMHEVSLIFDIIQTLRCIALLRCIAFALFNCI